MTIREPESIEECVYFTKRALQPGGIAKAWVYRIDCPKCGKAKMGKPVVKGKVKSKAKEYVCPECGYTEDKPTHEPKLTVEVKYTCPFCQFSGEATTEYKRKKLDGIEAYIFTCGKCAKKIGITKKLK
jgi:predicted RNA-binding Zn-ribbon protein involved in translation (DUF1610 family)